MNSKCSIVIPVYNEEDEIFNTIEQIYSIMENTDYQYEIVLVDDGSTDKTAKSIDDFVKGVYNDIKVIQHEWNQGYGAALKSGVKSSAYKIIVITDSDGTYPNENIPKLLSHIESYDMVVGARTGKNVKIPLVRKPAKWMLNKLANYLSGYKIPDLNSGLRVMKKELVGKYIKYLPDGFSFTTTITLALLTNRYQVKYISIDYMARKGKSKIKPVKDTLNFINLIIRTVMYFNPLKVFLPFSLLFFIPGFAFLIRDLLALNISQASILLIITGGLILSIGMLADLINKRL